MEKELESLTKRTERMREKVRCAFCGPRLVVALCSWSAPLSIAWHCVCLTWRVQTCLQAKGFPKYEEMLNAARKLRTEQEREDELQNQAQDQRAQLDRSMTKYQRVQEQLREVRSTGVTGGSDGLMRRIEEENNMFKFLSTEKLPNEIEEKKKSLAELMAVVQQPSMFQDDLNELHNKIDTLRAETNQLIEKRMVATTQDDPLALFRQQASIITRKKENKSNELKEQQDELAEFEEHVSKKRAIAEKRGPRMLKNDEFKRYVASCAPKAQTTKPKRRSWRTSTWRSLC